MNVIVNKGMSYKQFTVYNELSNNVEICINVEGLIITIL